MSNRPADSGNRPRRGAFRRLFEVPFDILTLLNSKMGCDQLQREVMRFIKDNKWFAIEQALEALEEDVLLINVFSAGYTAKPNGKSPTNIFVTQINLIVYLGRVKSLMYTIEDDNRLYVSTPCILRGALTKFAPVGFHSMLNDLAEQNHPIHDQYYDGGFDQTIQTASGSVVYKLPLPILAKRQFEPVLEEDLPPLNQTEHDLRLHLKKHSCK